MQRLAGVVMFTDALVLALLGLALLAAPRFTLQLFGYSEVPRSIYFIVGTWGAALVSISAMYFRVRTATLDRQREWVIFGLLRNLLEALVAIGCIAGGVATLGQAWPGLFIPSWFAVFYGLLVWGKLPQLEAAHVD